VEGLKILIIYEKSKLSPYFKLFGHSSALLTVPVRMSSSFGLCSSSFACSCPNHLFIRTLLFFSRLLLSESSLLSDSAILLSPAPVRIISSFGLCSPSFAYSCPNHLFFRTLLSFSRLLLSESSLLSDSAILLSPARVRISTPFGLCSPFLACYCPNHLLIRTLLSFSRLLLSESALHSDSALLRLPAPVRISTPFGLCSPFLAYSCPNHLLIRTLLSFVCLLLSESALHSDSALLLSIAPVRITSFSFNHLAA